MCHYLVGKAEVAIRHGSAHSAWDHVRIKTKMVLNNYPDLFLKSLTVLLNESEKFRRRGGTYRSLVLHFHVVKMAY